MKKILLFILLLLGNQCYSQSIEMIGSEIFGYRLSDAVNGNYNVIRTDEDGKVVWVKPVITDNNIPFDLSENQYIIYGFTEVKNGKIINNPFDYDYWLVVTDTTYDITVYPNPTDGVLQVRFNSTSSQAIDIRVMNMVGQQLIGDSMNNFSGAFQKSYDLSSLPSGVYLFQIATEKGSRTERVIVQR
jgi:hypothetical protein